MDRPPVDADAHSTLVAATSAALASGHDDFAVLAAGDLALCAIDARDDQFPIVFANSAFLALSGYAHEEIIGHGCEALQGSDADPAEIAYFRDNLTRGRPFQIEIVHRRNDGNTFRNEISLSPVRDETGEAVRYVGIITETPNFDDTIEGHAVAALRHQFRNQIQNMTSLVSLLGQRLPEGEGRTAFEDLRARFEAINVLQKIATQPGSMIQADRILFALIDQVIRLFDPGMRHDVKVDISSFVATPRRTNALSQIVAELLIDMFRNGLGEDASRTARLSITCSDDNELRIVSSVANPAPEAPRGSVGALGVMILENLVRALGGSIVRQRAESLDCEVVVPPEPPRR